MSQLDQRFFSSTRGQIVTILRRNDATVDELASSLGLTDNAVRSHLATLERDGLAEQAGVRRGVSKPSAVYRLTQDASRLYKKSDGSLLRSLLQVLQTRLPRHQLREVFLSTGKDLAAQFPPATGTLEERVQQSAELMGELGGLAEVESTDSAYVIHGYSCPFAAASPDHPAVCQLAAAILTEYIGSPALAFCQPTDSGAPRCLIEVLRETAAATGGELGATSSTNSEAGESMHT